MISHMSTNFFSYKLQNTHKGCSKSYSFVTAASMDSGVKIVTNNNAGLDTKERISKFFDKVELSVSSYDTAWVSMVPSPNSSQSSCFPDCVKWLLDNQCSDGSWGNPHYHDRSIVLKDAFTSILACILALKRWGVGEAQINKGLQFIELNFTSATEDNQRHPIGFDIIFPGMLEYARDLDLNLPLEPTDITAMFYKRDLEIKRCYSEGRRAYLAYVSEGIGKLNEWEMVMKYQRKDGSILNSPSTTAAALSHVQNDGCLNYLHSLLLKFGNAVPAVYPLDIYVRLCLVDSLERLGIERHFNKEIRSVLDETYRCWLQGEEEIFMDIATCAMAFRLLRLHGYGISSDPLSRFTKEEYELNSPWGYLKDIGAALELYKASQIIIYPDESELEKQNSWSSHFLKTELYNGSIHSDRLDKYFIQEVDDALKFPFHASLERIANKRNIEHCNADNTRILKTLYCSSNVDNKDFIKLAVEDFDICQSIHREELQHLERWVVENRLDKLKFARQRSAYCFFAAAATIFSPELSDARMSWAKNAVLTTVVDDFFDVGGSIKELENLIHLVEKWDVDASTECCSKQVQIIFSALHSTISEIGGKAFTWQGGDVTSHVKQIWLDLLKSMMREAEWGRDQSVPKMDEYMINAYVSFALGPVVLPALYFLGPKLSEEVACSSEIHNLFKLMSNCGRLLNDIQSFKRESKEGKLNAVSLHMIRSGMAEEESVGEIKRCIYFARIFTKAFHLLLFNGSFIFREYILDFHDLSLSIELYFGFEFVCGL